LFARHLCAGSGFRNVVEHVILLAFDGLPNSTDYEIGRVVIFGVARLENGPLETG